MLHYYYCYYYSIGNFDWFRSRQSSPLQQLLANVAETKKMCELLLERQNSLEKLVTTALAQMQSNIDKLVPPSLSSPICSDSPLLSNNHATSLSEIRLNPSVKENSTSASTANFLGDITNKTPEMHLNAFVLAPLQARSCSRENLALNLVKELFSEEDRISSNVRGKYGKKQLDKKKLAYIKDVTFQSYPSPTSDVKQAWSKCIKAIDSTSRAFNRSKKLST